MSKSNVLEKGNKNEQPAVEANDDDNDDDEDEQNDDEENGNNCLHNASMTESYSEILNSPIKSSATDRAGSVKGTPIKIPSRRPTTLLNQSAANQSSFPHGSVSIDDGNMTHFVADDLEYKIKIASPVSKKEIDDFTVKQSIAMQHESLPTESVSAALLHRQFLSSIPQIDQNVLNDIEIEAQYLAANIDNITENLYSLLHSISSIAADNVETYKSAVNKLTDCMDANIKTMYTIMAKTEEILKGLKSTEHLATKIRDIRRLVDILDSSF